MAFIYGLLCPIEGVIRYVGKSVRPEARLIAHIQAAQRGDYNHRTARWIRKVLAAGQRPTLVILHEVAPGERWQDVERSFISSAESRGWRLTNSTAGGEGLDYIDPEAERTYRANLSKAMTELWSTPERRRQARERARAFYADEAAAARKAEAVREAYRDPDVIRRARIINSEINSRPEVRAKKSAAAMARARDPVARKRQLEGFTEAVRSQMSASARARWADPEKGRKGREGNASPARRAKLSDAASRRATPEYRALMAERTRASWSERRRKAEEASK